ncbi:mobilization relaxase, partial [Vibrio lentus]|nr:mobilization relaxase [Vibrio lentus]
NQRRHPRPEPTHERISFEKLALDSAERSACFGRLFERDLVAGNNHRPEPNRDQQSAIGTESTGIQRWENPPEFVRRTDLHSSSRGQWQLDEKQRRQTDVHTRGV